MTCGSCAARVERILGRQPGVVDAQVNYATQRAHVEAAPDVDVEHLRRAVDKIGYGLSPIPTAAPRAAARTADPEADARRAWALRLAVGWPLSLVVLVLSMFGGEAAMMDPATRWALLLLT